MQLEALPEVECAAVFLVHRAAGAFRPLGTPAAPLLAPAARAKPRTAAATELGGLLLEALCLEAPLPRQRSGAGSSSASGFDEGGTVGRVPGWPALPAGGSREDVEAAAGAGLGLGMRRAASLSDLDLLRRASQPPAGAEALAQQLAWSRSLRDAPHRALQVRCWLTSPALLCLCEV